MPVASSTAVSDLQLPLSIAATELQLDLDVGQLKSLADYVTLLRSWNQVHSLSAVNDGNTLVQHVVDCLSVVRPFTGRLGRHRVRALDAGTGAGLPAVVLAIALPEWVWTAVDAVGKKVAFVRQVAGELKLRNLHPIHSRLERLEPEQVGSDLITSRAYGSLRQFVGETQHLLRPDGCWAAMKGKVPESEMRELPANCELFHVEPLTVPALNAARCLVWMNPRSPRTGH